MGDIDYKELLKKYITYVFYEEGTDFIQFRGGTSATGYGITEDEWKELKKLSTNEETT